MISERSPNARACWTLAATRSLLMMLALASAHAVQAQTPSFDCRSASNYTERLICGSSTLARLDSVLTQAYKAAREVDRDGASHLIDEQRKWLAGRGKRCKVPETGAVVRPAAVENSIACLEALYRGRIAELGGEPSEIKDDGFGGFLHPQCVAMIAGDVFHAEQSKVEISQKQCRQQTKDDDIMFSGTMFESKSRKQGGDETFAYVPHGFLRIPPVMAACSSGPCSEILAA